MSSTVKQAPATPPRRRAWPRRLLALLVGSVLALVACELAVRALDLHVARRGGRTEPVSERVDDPDFVFRLVPGRPVQRYRNADGTELRVRYSINPQFFRGPSVPLRKEPGTRRIIVIGDSFVFGTGVADEDTLPRALERGLRERAPDRPVEVLNFGVPGYGIDDLLARLERDALPYGPDVVLLSLYINDAVAFDARGADRRLVEPKVETFELRWIDRLGLTSNLPSETAGLPAAQRCTIALRRRSRFLDVVGDRLFQALFSRHTLSVHAHSWRSDGPGWERVRHVLAEFARHAESHDFELHVGLYPLLAELDDSPYQEIHQRLGSYCAELGVPYHDFLVPLAGLEAADLWAHEHDHHPSAACHERVASWLAERLAPAAVATD